MVCLVLPSLSVACVLLSANNAAATPSHPPPPSHNPPPLLLADFVIVSPVTELAKTVLAFALGITRGATVVTYVQNNVHVPPRPKALGPPPPWHMRLVGQEPPGTPKLWLRTGKVVPLL